MKTRLKLEQVSLGYTTRGGTNVVVDHLNLDLAEGEIVCLLGTSGVGKSTVLRAIAGFDPILAGRIVLDEKEISTPGSTLAPERRRIGYMFQDFALFPHLTVHANISFGLRALGAVARAQKVAQLLGLVHLEAFAGRYPHELSGGQQQRVALARALAPAPSLLLLDEPFSSLDTTTRETLVTEVRNILKVTGTTALVVTHNEEEARAIGDRVFLLPTRLPARPTRDPFPVHAVCA